MRALAVASLVLFTACSSTPSKAPVTTMEGDASETTDSDALVPTDSDASVPTDSDASVPADSDADAADSSRYPVEEFSSFHYGWLGYGEGQSGSFDMDRDCRIVSRGKLHFLGTIRAGTGLVPAADCNAFKSLVLSAEVIAAYEKYAATGVCDPSRSDDYVQSTIKLVAGTTHTLDPVRGCSGTTPFDKLLSAMTRLANMYSTGPLPPSDSGTD